MSTYISLLLCGSLLVVSCQPESPGSSPLVLTPVAPGVPAAPILLSDPSVPDSIGAYRPVFGSATTVRQFPFGPTNQPTTTFHLLTVLYNSKLTLTYQYTDEDRLTERTNYYTDGTHIFQKVVYSYKEGSIAKLSTLLNKEAPFLEGYPRNNELLPAATINFVSDTASWVKKISQTSFALYSFELGNALSRLGFSPSGALIWEEQLNERGKVASYSLYRRNETGNITFQRTGSLSNQWTTDYFTYDDKPNPSRTTGDSQTAGIAGYGLETSNTNNVLTRRSINSSGGQDVWHYEYTYRPDGYPSQVKEYRNNDPAGTIEFIYNQ